MLTMKLLLERLDKEGRVLERREQPSRSFILNFINLLYIAHAQLQSGAPRSMTDISNSARNVDTESNTGIQSRSSKANLRIGSASGSSGVFCYHGYITRHNTLTATIEGSKIGIQVGTGTTAPTPTDIAMETRIAHGRSAGELEYGGCELVGIAFADPDGEFTIRRYFTNASGGSITVNEVGIHSVGTEHADYADAWAFLIARDKVDPGVAVADGEILRATYVPQITV